MLTTTARPPAAALPALAEAMVSAFAGDPLYRWLYPEPGRRAEALRETFVLMLDAGLARGAVHTDAAGAAVAVWTPPGVELLDASGERRFLDLLARHAPDRVGDALAGMGALAAHRPAGPAFTLHSVAVRAGVQGRGVGRRLLDPVLRRCDADGVAVSLDTSNPRNAAFYARLGFRATAEERVPGGGPLMRVLVRPPAAARRADQPS